MSILGGKYIIINTNARILFNCLFDFRNYFCIFIFSFEEAFIKLFFYPGYFKYFCFIFKFFT
jgi:hypothetical protein